MENNRILLDDNFVIDIDGVQYILREGTKVIKDNEGNEREVHKKSTYYSTLQNALKVYFRKLTKSELKQVNDIKDVYDLLLKIDDKIDSMFDKVDMEVKKYLFIDKE